MPISRRSLVAALAATPFLPRAAFAAYPDRPIRLIVPFAAGGNADFVARLVGEGMSQALGQPLVVEFRTGAGGGPRRGQLCFDALMRRAGLRYEDLA